MILFSITSWIGLVVYGVSIHKPDCTEMVQVEIIKDVWQKPQSKIQHYESGISVYLKEAGRTIDYFLTESEDLYKQALSHGYQDLGTCYVKGVEVHFTKGTQDLTEGA